MSYFINNQQKINDIIFANRNKAYGAYVIRSSYGATVVKSLSIMLSGVGCLALTVYLLTKGPFIDPKSAVGQLIHDSIYVIPFGPPKEEKVLPKKKIIEGDISNQKPSTTKNTNPIIVDSTHIDNSAVVTTTATSVSNTTNSANENPDPGNESSGNNGATNTVVVNDIKSDLEVDSLPQFEGGLKAMYRIVSNNLRYPERALDANKEGVVYVRFVVDETGKVGSLHLQNSLGYGLDEEALRVVGLIPKFKSPAKAKGHAVKMYYQLPIRFRQGH